MIFYTDGDMFEDNVIARYVALVNPINCIGVMGKGLAKQFRARYRGNYVAYVEACEKENVVPGHMFVYEAPSWCQQPLIINFPTKDHWRDKSELWMIEEGMKDLVRVLKRYSVRTVAIPALGCGLGGLPWDKVREIIERHLSPLGNNILATVYLPKHTNKGSQ